MGQVPPILLSSIICDRVIIDRITGSATLINILQTISAVKYPVRYQMLIYFCELTNGHGPIDIGIKLVGDQDKVLFSQNGKINFQDVKQIQTLTLNLGNIVFPEAGEYRFQVFAGETMLGERRIQCRKIEEKK